MAGPPGETSAARLGPPPAASSGNTSSTSGPVLDGCVQELLDTVAGVRPLPLNEASTEKLYRWAPRMITIMDLMIKAREVKDDPKRGDIALAVITNELAELADQAFLNDIYDLFKQLANRSVTVGVILIRTYEARCDGVGSIGGRCGAPRATGSIATTSIEEAEAAGWLRRGRKLYCPECRGKYEPNDSSACLSNKSAWFVMNYCN